MRKGYVDWNILEHARQRLAQSPPARLLIDGPARRRVFIALVVKIEYNC